MNEHISINTSNTDLMPWRNTQLSPMFFSFSYELFFLFILLFLVPTWTLKAIGFLLIVMTITAFKVAEARGLTPTRVIKAIFFTLYSKKRPAWSPKHDRYSIDHTPLPPFIRTFGLRGKFGLFSATVIVFTLSFSGLPGGITGAKAEFHYIAPDLLASAPVMTIHGKPLKSAVGKIVPDGFKISYDQNVSSTEKIEWRSDKQPRPASGVPWTETLKDALRPAGLEYHRDGTKIQISKIPPKKPKPQSWSVKKGDRLSGVLKQWGKVAKTRVRFLTDRDWPIEENYHFTGSFETATESLLTALSGSNPAPVGELQNNRKLLLILNREQY